MTGKDINTLQELCLETYLTREIIKSSEEEKRNFELQLFLHRPEVYEKYMEEEEERKTLGYDQVVWKQPETAEELEMILEAVQKNEEIFQKNEKEKDFSVEANFLEQFKGIDLSQIMEDDG